MFDTIHTPGRCAQLKCFGRRDTNLELGDTVVLQPDPPFGPEYGEHYPIYDNGGAARISRFQVAMPPGGWLQIINHVIVVWSDQRAEGIFAVDLWGRPFDTLRHEDLNRVRYDGDMNCWRCEPADEDPAGDEGR